MPPAFSGFEPEDFELFAIPDFAGRMAEIRARLRPKLVALGGDLSDRVGDLVGGAIFPHAALHMRRRVNPPEETWAAFGRDKRGYKRWTHYRIAVSGAGVRVTVFVEDDADDKPLLAQALQSRPQKVLKALGKVPVHWSTFTGAPVGKVKPEIVVAEGERLGRIKLLKFQASIPIPREVALAFAPGPFEEWALEQMTLLKPLYVAASTGK